MRTFQRFFPGFLILVSISLVAASCGKDDEVVNPPPPSSEPTSYTYQVDASYPHADTAFTQGFEYEGSGVFLEGTGQTGHSYVWRKELATGNLLKQHKIDNLYFGEGVTQLGNRIYQLTWTNGVCFVYDAVDLAAPGPVFGTSQEITAIDTLDYTGEGWGLTNDGSEIIMSNGSSLLRYRNPDDFSTTREFRVQDRDRYLTRLNELELIGGMIYANVWQTDSIAVIDPSTEKVTAWIDLSGLPLPGDITGGENVLNGIAYDATNQKLYVTGKYWSKVYEITLIEVTP